MDDLLTFIKPILARVIGSGVTALAAFLMMHFGIVMPPETQAAMISVGVFAILAVYGIVHSLIHKTKPPSTTPAK